jgi:hypothetical protein
MGRHGGGGEPVPTTRTGRLRAAVVRWLERLAIALGAGAAALAVLRWSGVSWTTTWWCVGGVALLVLVASALAATLPQPAPPSRPARTGRDAPHR